VRIGGHEVRQNWLDRTISFVSPVAGARRLHARTFLAIAGGYLGARRDRPATSEWHLTNNSADADTLPDIQVLRDRSRDLARNAPLATGALNTVVQNVVGGGLTWQPKPDARVLGLTEAEAEAWADAAKSEFLLWAESIECDYTRTQNFYGLQALAFRSALESGDVLALFPMIARRLSPYQTAVQIVEADRLETPRGTREGGKLPNGNPVCGGVELDSAGAAIAYHILDKHPGDPDGRSSGSHRVAAYGSRTGRRNVVHLFDRTRPGQHRGVPYLAPVIEALKQLTKFSEAELMASVLSAMIAVFVKSPTGQGLNDIPGVAGTDTSATTKQEEVRLGSGGVIDLAPGEDVVSFSPNRPNQAFDAFFLANCRQIGVALGLPFEVLVKHFTASYSAARAALLEAWTFYLNRRALLAGQFCQPAVEVWMEEAVARGRIDAPGFFDRAELRRAYLLSEWNGDVMPQIDQTKEVEAAQKRIDGEFSTLTIETRQLTGRDWNDVHRERVKEKKLQAADGTVTPERSEAGADGSSSGKEPAAPPRENQGDLETAEARA
jgi:lambda family phage portal protein